MPRRLLAALAALLGRPPAAPGALPVEFRRLPPPPGDALPQVRAEGGDGVIRVAGEYAAGVCHATERREARLRGQTVTLTVALSGRRRGPCPEVQELVAYHAVVGGLAPGRYRVVVEHAGTDDDGVRLDAEVEVR